MLKMAVLTVSDVTEREKRITRAISIPVIAVISELVCLGLIRSMEILLLPNRVPRISPK
jgi:hypothetical protein